MSASGILSACIESDSADLSTPEGIQQHMKHLQSLMVMLKKAQDILHEEKGNMDTVRDRCSKMDLTRDGQWTGNYEEKAEEGRESLLLAMKKVDGKTETLLLETESAMNKIRQELENCRNMAAGEKKSEA
ncbi:hypothetical protein SAMN06296386_11376 [Lachnospiraceae bacterium]|nr:hypothetical protein SAMN06296386_11376 [Lachnospiraceae bacterium]